MSENRTAEKDYAVPKRVTECDCASRNLTLCPSDDPLSFELAVVTLTRMFKLMMSCKPLVGRRTVVYGLDRAHPGEPVRSLSASPTTIHDIQILSM